LEDIWLELLSGVVLWAVFQNNAGWDNAKKSLKQVMINGEMTYKGLNTKLL
jgi:hypothetical protein